MTTSLKQKRKRKNNSNVLGAGNLAEVRTIAACITRSRTRKCSASLPRDMIFNILIRLPARVVHEIMRYVCKEWNDIISDPCFISAHLLHSSSLSGGILVQDHARPQHCCFIWTDNATGKKHLTEHQIPFPATILGSCNGLILLQDKANPRALQVMNLVTKEKMSLPPLPGVLRLDEPLTTFVFTPSGHYKVVHVYIISNKEKQFCDSLESLLHGYLLKLDIQVMLFTVGVDKNWRVIDWKELMVMRERQESREWDWYGLLREQYALLSGPVSSTGYVCWFDHCFKFVIGLDVDAETMYQFSAPKDYVEPIENSIHALWLKTDTGVSMVHMIRPAGIWKMWKIIEPKSGTWGRVRDVSGKDMDLRLTRLFYPCTIQFCYILIGLENGDLWFTIGVDDKYALVCYNPKTRYLWSIPARSLSFLRLPDAHLHVNSLLSLKNL